MDGTNTDKNPYCSVDPAPPAVRKSVPDLRCTLLDESLPLFERYRAMFALRNLGNEEAVLALGDGRIQYYSLVFYLSLYRITQLLIEISTIISLQIFFKTRLVAFKKDDSDS